MKQTKNLVGLDRTELEALALEIGEPKFRGRQLFRALYKRRLRACEEMTDLPVSLRHHLSETMQISNLRIESRHHSSDGTCRYLLKTRDGHPVETVFIPEERHDTICFSSQSGCPLQCKFCLTANLGLIRNLTAGEIVEQVIIALNESHGVGLLSERAVNLVGMGAGEPFLNYDALIKSLELMADPEGLHIVGKRVTISTAGVVPRIRDLARLNLPGGRPHLAISLSAPTDELRNHLMPINRKWPLAELLSASREFQTSLRSGERMTFEYVLLAGVNDGDEQAQQLANLLNRYHLVAKVNLIPHNSAEPLEFRPPTEERILKFKQILKMKGVDAFVRKPRGRDVYAACGQLAARTD